MRDLSSALSAALTSEGYRVRLLAPGKSARRQTADRYEADFNQPQSLRELRELLGAEGIPIGGIINLLGLTPEFCRPALEDPDISLTAARQTFLLVQTFETDLRSAVPRGGGWFLNLTGLDGQFGLGGEQVHGLAAAGLLGITKTLARENAGLTVKAIDVDPRLEAPVLAAQLVLELAEAGDSLEIGLTAQGRWRPILRQIKPAPLGKLDLGPDAVLVVTGGANGVTARVAEQLALECRCRILLVGRSPLPSDEDERTVGLSGQALRARLIELARAAGGAVRPADIEKQRQRLQKDREIRATLDRCRSAGATVEYVSLDVRDEQAFADWIEGVYRRLGRIDGVVHGAGIIDDKRIRDKSLESFVNVYRTKATSATVLAEKLRPDSLKFLALFSSVSGRFGNAGQADYSAANEYLNKLADDLARRWPGRVVAINWGPWDGGMVTDELRRLYAQVGFQMIPIEQGIRSFLSEVTAPETQSAEVVVSCSVERMQAGLAVSA